MTQEANDKRERAAALKARAVELEAEEKKLNEGRTGKGLRAAVGMSRGKAPVKVVYEAFDESQPATLPTTLAEFLALTKLENAPDAEKLILAYLIDGFNSASYTTASDPIAEFIDASWSEEAQKQFRLVIRNYANATGVSIDDAVALIKPGFAKAQAA